MIAEGGGGLELVFVTRGPGGGNWGRAPLSHPGTALHSPMGPVQQDGPDASVPHVSPLGQNCQTSQLELALQQAKMQSSMVRAAGALVRPQH